MKNQHQISGFLYIDNFISENQEVKLIQHIDSTSWSTELKRRVQHYGYKYNYKNRSIDKEMYIGPLPDWSLPVVKKIYNKGLMQYEPDQLIVNEYFPGQGIAHHKDCQACFTDEIVSISLLSHCTIEFKNKEQKYTHILYPRSLFKIKDAARYEWMHGIPARKTDLINGYRWPRDRRISLTFRKVILD